MGRFVNGDDSNVILVETSVISCNTFLYCRNNPLIYTDYTGLWLVTLSVSLGAAVGIGLNVFGTFVLDSYWNLGFFFGFTVISGLLVKGIGVSAGFIWGIDTLDEYKDPVITSRVGSYVFGVSETVNHPEYNRNDEKKDVIGIQILYGSVGIYYESGAIDGGFYIPLGEIISEIISECGKNVFRVIDAIKQISIIIT